MERELGGKLTVLQRQKVDFNNGEVVVLGCTLHSYIPEDYTELTNDFAKIEGWRVAHHNDEHAADLEWLEQSLAEVHTMSPQSRVIIATHYAPSFENTVPPEREHNAVGHCFSSNILKKFRWWRGADMVSHWIFGHTHYNNRFAFNDVTVVSNTPSGLIPERSPGLPFDPKLVI